MIKKLALLVLFVAFVSAPALAGNIPEFDTVGQDSANYFNGFVKQMVVDNNLQYGIAINNFSDWTGGNPIRPYVNNVNQLGPFPKAADEFFASSGTPRPDDCFPNYDSFTSGALFPDVFQWLIVLQMAPETDIDLNMWDCVTKQNQTNIWFYAQQTGRWRNSASQLVFKEKLNPYVAVWAIPGPRATFGFTAPFQVDARLVPQARLKKVTLNGTTRFTSKALWEETIVIAMPDGGPNADGAKTYMLREGDMMFVQFVTPDGHPADVRYGVDNVSLKYVGVIGHYITN
jgi:hypothetical protein